MNLEDGSVCFTCQDFEKNVGHATKWCPKNVCQKCGQKGHVKMVCMFGLENFPLPNEIFLQILGYLSGKDLEQSAKVSKRFKEICDTRKLEEKKKLQRKRVKCPICYKILYNRSTWNLHLRVHRSETQAPSGGQFPCLDLRLRNCRKRSIFQNMPETLSIKDVESKSFPKSFKRWSP